MIFVEVRKTDCVPVGRVNSRVKLAHLAVILLVVLCSGLWFGTDNLASAQTKTTKTAKVDETAAPAAEKLDARSRAVWARYWQAAARNFIKFDGEYLCIRGYNERFPSSKGVTVSGLLDRDKGYTMRLKTYRGTTVDQRIYLSRAEAQAMAMALPKMAVGNYGFIHSVEVERVIGPTEMIVRSVWLVDAQSLYRARDEDRARLAAQYDGSVARQLVEALYQNRVALVNMQQQPVFSRELMLEGFPTGKLTSGMRWRGPGGGGLQLAILAIRDFQDDNSRQGPRRILVAAPVGRLRSGLDRKEFDALLTARHITHKEMITVIDEANRNVVHDVEKSMVDAIEAKAPARKSIDEDQ